MNRPLSHRLSRPLMNRPRSPLRSRPRSLLRSPRLSRPLMSRALMSQPRSPQLMSLRPSQRLSPRLMNQLIVQEQQMQMAQAMEMRGHGAF